jgi:hypothetical protein
LEFSLLVDYETAFFLKQIKCGASILMGFFLKCRLLVQLLSGLCLGFEKWKLSSWGSPAAKFPFPKT